MTGSWFCIDLASCEIGKVGGALGTSIGLITGAKVAASGLVYFSACGKTFTELVIVACY